MESFVFYTHYAEKMKKLPPEQAANLLYAICDYVENGTEPELEDIAADMCFSFIRTQLDKDTAKYEETCRKRAEAGRKGAAATNGKRRQKAAKAANADFAVNEKKLPGRENESDQIIPRADTAVPEPKEPVDGAGAEENGLQPKPEKKPRKKKDDPQKVAYGEFVRMTAEEYEKLIAKHGQEKTARMIEVLDNYKGSNGKTYKNDYRAILNWVVDRVEEEFARKGAGSYGGFNSNTANRPEEFRHSTGFKEQQGKSGGDTFGGEGKGDTV